jgi:hypothetical protein
MSVDALAAALAQHVDYVLNTAASSPAGGGPQWDEVLRYYRVQPHDAQERAMIVQYMRLQRGATPAEVRTVLEGLRTWAFGEIERLRADPSIGQSPALGQLHGAAQTLVERETARYELSIGLQPAPAAAPAAPPKPAAPSLGSIFANAQQTSKEVPWANMEYKQVATLTCVHCGGPQETPLDFMCKFCRRPIAGTVKPTK